MRSKFCGLIFLSFLGCKEKTKEKPQAHGLLEFGHDYFTLTSSRCQAKIEKTPGPQVAGVCSINIMLQLAGDIRYLKVFYVSIFHAPQTTGLLQFQLLAQPAGTALSASWHLIVR